jgi:hypothetical protein
MEPTFERIFGGKNAMRLTSACGTERTYRGKLAHVRFEERSGPGQMTPRLLMVDTVEKVLVIFGEQ